MVNLSAFMEETETYNRWSGTTKDWPVKRTQRYPQYSDHELTPFFEEISKGYCYKQSSDNCLYPSDCILNILYSDDETFGYMLDLSMVAGARIRSGEQAPPVDRYDGLYDEFIKV